MTLEKQTYQLILGFAGSFEPIPLKLFANVSGKTVEDKIENVNEILSPLKLKIIPTFNSSLIKAFESSANTETDDQPSNNGDSDEENIFLNLMPEQDDTKYKDTSVMKDYIIISTETGESYNSLSNENMVSNDRSTNISLIDEAFILLSKADTTDNTAVAKPTKEVDNIGKLAQSEKIVKNELNIDKHKKNIDVNNNNSSDDINIGTEGIIGKTSDMSNNAETEDDDTLNDDDDDDNNSNRIKEQSDRSKLKKKTGRQIQQIKEKKERESNAINGPTINYFSKFSYSGSKAIFDPELKFGVYIMIRICLQLLGYSTTEASLIEVLRTYMISPYAYNYNYLSCPSAKNLEVRNNSNKAFVEDLLVVDLTDEVAMEKLWQKEIDYFVKRNLLRKISSSSPGSGSADRSFDKIDALTIFAQKVLPENDIMIRLSESEQSYRNAEADFKRVIKQCLERTSK